MTVKKVSCHLWSEQCEIYQIKLNKNSIEQKPIKQSDNWTYIQLNQDLLEQNIFIKHSAEQHHIEQF